MSFQVLIPSVVTRDLKKLDKPALAEIKRVIFKELATSPERGKPVQGLPKVLAWKLRMAKTDYRIAYRFDPKAKIVYLLMVKSRENFYSELRKRL